MKHSKHIRDKTTRDLTNAMNSGGPIGGKLIGFEPTHVVTFFTKNGKMWSSERCLKTGKIVNKPL